MSTKFCLRAAPWRVAAIIITALLASCHVSPAKPGPAAPPVESQVPPAPGPVQPGSAAPAVAGRVFHVLPGESEVRMLVYRGGSFAQFGHNHVITSHDLGGTVTLPEDPTQAQFEILMPVAPLTVDDPDQRAQEGADFASQVNDGAREGTRRNMLKPQVLDGDRYPLVTVHSKSITRAGEDYDVVFEVELRGLKHALAAPVHVAIDGGRLAATGELTFNQSDLGITPFTAGMGALAVKDEVRLKFDIHATVSER